MDARRTSARGAASQRHPFAAPPLRPELAAALVPGATFERTFTEQITYTATVEAVDRRPSATWVDVRWEEVEPGSGAGRERLQADSLAEDHIALTAQEVRPPAPPSPRAVQNEYEEQRAAAIRRNNEMLAQLGVTKAKAAARRAEEAEAASAQRTARRNREDDYPDVEASPHAQLLSTGVETYGRWSPDSLKLVRQLSKAKAARAPPLLRRSAEYAFSARWWALLSVAV